MTRIVFVLLVSLAAAAMAQAPPREPPEVGARGGLWQRLTPDQRALLWRSLTPEQKAELWRNMDPNGQRAARDPLTPDGPEAPARRWMPHRGFDRGDGPPHMMMSPEERQRMREQIREANRLRRERFDSERGRRRDR